MVKKKRSNKQKKQKSKQNLRIHFMPYSEISQLDLVEKIRKIMGLVLDNQIVILQGKLKPEEETRLIENSMTLIGNIEGFQGIEIATLSGEAEYVGIFKKIKSGIIKILVGEKDALTIIGPASIVKEMAQDPKKVDLLLKD